jgi:hypothetical protein
MMAEPHSALLLIIAMTWAFVVGAFESVAVRVGGGARGGGVGTGTGGTLRAPPAAAAAAAAAAGIGAGASTGDHGRRTRTCSYLRCSSASLKVYSVTSTCVMCDVTCATCLTCVTHACWGDIPGVRACGVRVCRPHPEGARQHARARAHTRRAPSTTRARVRTWIARVLPSRSSAWIVGPATRVMYSGVSSVL